MRGCVYEDVSAHVWLDREDITEGGSDDSGDCSCNSKSDVLFAEVVGRWWWQCCCCCC